MVGIYTASGNDQSWILTIFQKQDDIEVAYYEVQGLLDDIELIIEGYTPQLIEFFEVDGSNNSICLLYTSPSPRDATLSRMPSSA